MWSLVVEWGLFLLYAYLAFGVVFGVAFALRWVNRLDDNALYGSWGFRAAILPGAIVLWPFLMKRCFSPQPPQERSPHRDASGGGP